MERNALHVSAQQIEKLIKDTKAIHIMSQELVVLRHRGRMYHIPRGVMETDERSGDRAWYIAKLHPASKQEFVQAQDASHKWCNEKYLGMKYSEKTEA